MKETAENVFVFVVCGAAAHLDALHYSIQALSKFSKTEIVVLTDSLRNEIPIIHNSVIDILTPSHFDNHQASIYLKTGIHKFLPSGKNYCYLDTDVVAVSDRVDTIFENFKAPITFAPDHCVSDQFSPSAVKCTCAKDFAIWEKELKELFRKHKDLIREPENEEKKKKLLSYFEEAKKDKWRYWLLSLRFNLARKIFELDKDTFLNKEEHYWHDKEGAPILYENDVQSSVDIIESTTLYRCQKDQNEIWTINGKNVFDCRCNHLKEAIKRVFDIDVIEQNWQHWNGGVFLFNDSSHDFLNAWHEKTMKIFALPEWKTRDQGTLIATVWQFGLQYHPTLPQQFNLIADYLHRNIEHTGNLQFELKKEGVTVIPDFIHVYHHWADKRWDVWQAVESATGIEIDPDSQTINSLWIGKTLSKLELLTINSFLSLGYRFRLWIYESLETVLPEGVIVGNANDIVPQERVFAYRNKNKYGHGKGSYAGFSDIFRYKLLFDKGGWWVDMDVTCLKPLDFEQPYFFRNHHDLKVVGNVMKCPKNSQLMKLCYEEAMDTVNEHNTDWHKPINILNENISRLHLEKYIQYAVSNEDRWDVTSRYIWHEDPLPDEWFFIHWQNEEWRMKNVSRNHFYYKSALAELMRQHRLSEIPHSRTQEIMNTIQHSEFFRRLSVFN
ncbi:MAG: glycosyltransferase [Chitinophagales bacterium]